MKFDINTIREDFPIFRHRAYLDTACSAPTCLKVSKAVEDYWKMRSCIPAPSFEQTFAELQPVANARAEAAKLINASEDEVTFITSTGLGLNKIATALSMGKGDNIVLNDLDFSTNIVPWLPLRKQGVEIRRVKHRNGKLYLEDFEKVVDRHTKVIAISSVQWTTGFRVDLEALVKLAEANGAYVVVDSMQSLGALELDVRKTGIHFMVAQGYKWLFGPCATGIFFCRRDLIEKHEPLIAEPANVIKNPSKKTYLYELSLDNLADYDFGFVPTAARYQSCSNIPGLWGLDAALKYINLFGISNIEERVQNLVEYLIEGLKKISKVRIVSPTEREYRSGIVVFTYDSVGSDLKMMEKLSRLGVGVSVRYTAGCGGIRVSCHFYNNEDDLEKLLSSLKGLRKFFTFH